MNKFVMRSSGDPHPGLNPASFEATNTPSTSLFANAFFPPDYTGQQENFGI